MNAGTTAERVYADLKRALAAGAFAPGMRLEPARIADDLASSTTPVRDAMHRLVGEGLVDMRTSDGFHAPAIHESGLRDLYRWNKELVRAALRSPGSAPPAVEKHSGPVGPETLFSVIAASSRSREIARQVASANARLALPRRAEEIALGAAHPEIQEMLIAFESGSSSVRTRITNYHNYRIKNVSNIINVIYQRLFNIR
jgi:DNA-binding transcriptional MocR family regulator